MLGGTRLHPHGLGWLCPGLPQPHLRQGFLFGCLAVRVLAGLGTLGTPGVLAS